jgi:hypothetical protein
MKTEIEYEYAENCWLIGYVELLDGMLKVTDFKIIVWVNEFDYDLTAAFSKENYEFFKEAFSDYALSKNIGEAEGVMPWE